MKNMENKLLVIENKELITKLPAASQKYIVAKHTEKIVDLTTGKAIKGIYDILAQTMINCGNKKDLEDIELITNIAENIYNLINIKHPYLTIDEFKLICFNGVSLEYGEFFGINLTTISNWINNYKNDSKRIKAMHYWNNLIHLATAREKTPEEKRQIIIDGLLSLHKNLLPVYEKTNDKFLFEMPIISYIFYNFLKEINLLKFTQERKNEIYDRAKNKYEQKLIKCKLDPSIRFNQKDYEDVIANLNTDHTFANICKLEALRDYMFDIYEMNEDLNNLIQNSIKSNI
jgi:hypothetical protein